MLDHTCSGAECPFCGVFAVGQMVVGQKKHQSMEEKLRKIHTSPQAESKPLNAEIRKTLHDIQDQKLASFRDSRGMAVSTWPIMIVPSVTVIIRHSWMRNHWCTLVHQRDDNGWWGFPGGKCEIGESITQCALREGYEETGLTLQIDRLTSIDSDPTLFAICQYPDGESIHYVNHTFLASVHSGFLQKSHESLELQWATVDDLPEPFMPSHRWRLEQAMKNQPGVAVR